MRAQQALFVRNGSKVFVQHLLGIDDRTNLKEIEVAFDAKSFALVEIAGKLDFHRTTHLLRSQLLRELQDFRQREDAMLEDTREGDDLATALVDAVADNLVVGVVGGSNAIERLVLIGLLDAKIEDVETIVYLEIIAHMRHVEGIETGLRLLEGCVHLGGLQHLIRMIGRHTQGLSSIHNILTQTQGQRGNALLSQFVANGVIVERAKHTREGGIEASAILLTHHFLQDDSHLFLIDNVGGGSHIGLRVPIINRGINSLDGTSQHAKHLVLILKIRNHIGRVDTCKGLIMGVFQQRR